MSEPLDEASVSCIFLKKYTHSAISTSLRAPADIFCSCSCFAWEQVCTGLALLTALESLSLSSTRVDLSGESLWSLTQLTQLELTDCELRSLPEGVSSLVKLEQLMVEVREKKGI
jgi:hypothetical protein